MKTMMGTRLGRSKYLVYMFPGKHPEMEMFKYQTMIPALMVLIKKPTSRKCFSECDHCVR